ncbi:MAG TPA: CapA family protein, partial [Streptosporangiaceae bacterium]
MPRIGVAAAIVAAVGIAACTSAATQSRGGSAGTATASHRTSPASAHRSGRTARNITLAFAGDVHFTGRTTKLLRHPATAFGPIASLLKSADLTVVNLET